MADRVYPPVIAAARAMFATLGLHFLESGTENVPTSGGAVLVANHVSYLDFIFAGLAAHPSHRLVRFMAKESIFKHPIAGPLMRGMHHIPVDREAGASSYAAALRALRAGEIVGVFPEATISRAFELKDFKSGAVRLAMSSGVPLVPTITWGGQRIMTKGHPRDLHRGKTVSLTVGEPLHPSRRDDADEVTAELHARMSTLLERTIADYPDKPKDDDDKWWIPARYGGTAPTLEEAAALDKKH
jgi:1-acyl-sn-glycerol-3-phosphate acyltransferase